MASTGKRLIQMVMDYKFYEGARNGRVNPDEIHKQRTSFMTLDSAIANAEMWVNRTESWIDSYPVKIIITNKDTKEVLWSYKKAE